MTWTDINNTVFDTGEPTAGIHLKQMNDNFEGMANGDAGAPKIKAGALDPSIPLTAPPVSGISYLQKHCGSAFRTNQSGSFSIISFITSLGSGPTRVPVLSTVLVDGVFTGRFNKTGSSSNLGSLMVKNSSDTLPQTLFSTYSIGVSTFTFSASKGDILFFQYSGSDTNGTISDCEVLTGNNTVALA